LFRLIKINLFLNPRIVDLFKLSVFSFFEEIATGNCPPNTVSLGVHKTGASSC